MAAQEKAVAVAPAVAPAAVAAPVAEKPRPNCMAKMNADGTLTIQFTVRADMASRIVRRAGTRPLHDYVWDHIVRQFESVCY